MPKVSFIMPSIRDDDWFKISIRSILTQSLEDIELIIINDNHNRNTVFDDSRILWLDGFGGSQLSKCINKGLDAAAGEVVCFAFDDDVVFPEMAEILYNAFLIRDADVIYASNISINKESEVIQLCTFPIHLNPEEFNRDCALPIASDGFKLSSLRKHSVGWSEDFEFINDSIFLLDCYRAGFKFAGISIPLMYYRLHSNARSKIPKNIKLKVAEYYKAREKYDSPNLFARKILQWGME